MTDNPNAVFRGTYADFKIIKTRGVAQIVIEIPIEHGSPFVKLFDLPDASKETWVAIALLDDNVVRESPNAAATKAIQQAGILCNVPSFGVWLRDEKDFDLDQNNKDHIANALRALLGVQSRTELNNSPELVVRFNKLKGEYDEWMMNRDEKIS